MQVKPLGKTHLLLILTAAEARYLGIPTETGCAMILPTHTAFFPDSPRSSRKFRVRVQPQSYRFGDCGDLLDCVAHLCHLGFTCPGKVFFAAGAYYLVLEPKCRQLFSLRAAAGEYGALWGRSFVAAEHLAEHGRLICGDALHDLGQYLF